MKIIEEDGTHQITNMFSVIIRVKNEERWIGHAIQSVIDFVKDNEVIIVDNGSTDKSLQIAQSFNRNEGLNDIDSNYTSIRTIQIDEYTPGRALNAGAELANYENIIFLSSHCIITRFDQQEVLSKLNSYPAIFGKQIPVYQGKKITPRYIWSHFKDEEEVDMYSEQESRYFFHNAFSIVQKSLLSNIPFDDNLVSKEDRYWARDIIEKGGEHTLYDPSIECIHHYTSDGNTWKGVG